MNSVMKAATAKVATLKEQELEKYTSHLIIMQEMVSELEAGGVEEVNTIFSQLRMRRCGEKGDHASQSILWWKMSELMEPQMRYQRNLALQTLLQLHGAKILIGVAPPSDTERRLAERIKKLKERLQRMRSR